ncbi:MAG: EamA family transporter [Acidobacteriaceae bacterium]|jgi:inner membrane transporter RhtA|nr:EamA family transporter [Acidobacteriaceae bacterium]
MAHGHAWPPLLAYGLSLGTMNLAFYMALRTIPLGVAVALEFSGPLAVSAIASRRLSHFAWLALAVAGLLLLLPFHVTSASLDPEGVGFALAAGGCWALYIVCGQRAGAAHGVTASAWGLLIGSLVAVPIGIAFDGRHLFSPAVLPRGLAVAVLASALPYTLEMYGLRRLPARVFGTLMSLEPVIAAIAGLVFLHEHLTSVQWMAIGAVMIASLGTTAGAEPGPRAT